MGNETPMMRQYRAIKQEHQDAILFFRLGDFYEMFFDDAKEASQLLDLVLTARNGTPMCGIPYHASKTYIKRLIEHGKKVAICEQTELPENGKGLAKREVVQIITPGTVIDDDFLDSSRNNFICSIACHDFGISCSYADMSTGDFRLIDIPLDNHFDQLRSLLQKIQPVELLIQESYYFEHSEYRTIIDNTQAMITRYPDWYFSKKDAFNILTGHFNTVTLKQFGIESDDSRLLSAGVLFDYISHNAKQQLIHINRLLLIDELTFVHIDESAQRNLELVRNLQDRSEKNTLYSVLKHTKTAVGTRLLRDWIFNPLNDLAEIKSRQKRVSDFYQDQHVLNATRTHLGKVLDLERLTTRIIMNRAIPRDLSAIAQTVETIRSLFADHSAFLSEIDGNLAAEELTDLYRLAESIDSAIYQNIPGAFEEGKVIKDGYSPELDALRSAKDKGLEIITSYLDEIKQETGITNMKLKKNKIIGHFIEVSKAQTKLVPEYFLRKQTLVNGERYTTDRLIELERYISEARARSEELEKELYSELVNKVKGTIDMLLALSRFIAIIDCYQSFAYCAMKNGYIMPDMVHENILHIENGRHPVVESIMQPGEFVPNSIRIDQDTQRTALITGPNMSGKSTYLRQVALIVLMGHIGSFVPADSATIGLTDKIFCRVGATDNLARGESTFLVEMNETAYILRNATRRSLVIMDEVGRGTSTRDGVSIAYAVMNKLLHIGAKTLFATHYHELTNVQSDGLQKLYLDVIEENGEIIFLKKIRHGIVTSSYGIHAAELAGIPQDVLEVAKQFQKGLAETSLQPDLFLVCDSAGEVSDDKKSRAIEMQLQYIDRIRQKDINTMTPIEALIYLQELQKNLDNIESE